MSALTVVMYHYVRPREPSSFPRLPARSLVEFRGQLDFLQRSYRIVGLDEVREALRGRPLPERAAVLTFDDGYRDHLSHVFPELRARGLPAALFPPARAVLERELLSVHKIQLAVASSSAASSRAHLERALRAAEREFPQAQAILEAPPPTQVRFDDGDVAWVKRVLQRVRPEALRRRLVDEVFAATVGRDPRRIAEELYLTLDELRQLRAHGWEIGGHGWDHPWWDLLDAAEQEREISASLELIHAVGQKASPWSFAYPFGSFSAESARLLAQHGCGLAFTTEPAVADLARDPLKLPRLDTNDFPFA